MTLRETVLWFLIGIGALLCIGYALGALWDWVTGLII